MAESIYVMSKTSGAQELPKVVQWTRTGLVQKNWGSHESFEALVFSPRLAAQVQKIALGLLGAQEICAKARVAWRRGAFVWGPPGGGKTAVTRAVALLLGWRHVTISGAEILDVHHLVRALHESAAINQAVIVIENIDQILRRIDTGVFLDIFDDVSNRSEGLFWMATTRRPEDVSKIQLVRPGRFDDSLRIANPDAETKRKYYATYIEPIMTTLGIDAALSKQENLPLLEANDQLSFAHLEEMRCLLVRVLMDGDSAKVGQELSTYCQEQVIGFNRWGGRTEQALELEERVRHTDPRHLLSALEVTDAFKRVIELTVGSAAEALIAAEEQKG